MLKKCLAVVVCAVLAAGCPSAAQWFQIAAGLVPIVLQTVSGFQTANGGLPPAAEAAIQEYGALATTILNDVAADIKTAQTNTGVIPKLDAELAELQKQSQALIPQFTGNTSVLKWIDAISADVVDLINLVPVIRQATGPTAQAKVIKMKVNLPTAQSYQAIFQQRLQAAQQAQ